MRIALIILGVVLALVLIGGLIVFSMGVGVNNDLVRQREAVKAAWSQVDIALQRRADLIPNLVETVKGYATHEKDVIASVARARRAKRSPPTGSWTARSAACCWWWRTTRT
jgi:LemA protein